MPTTVTAEKIESTEVTAEAEATPGPGLGSRIVSGLTMWLMLTWLYVRASVARLRTGKTVEVPMSGLQQLLVSATMVGIGVGVGAVLYIYCPWQYVVGVGGLLMAVGEIPGLACLAWNWTVRSSVWKVTARVVAVCVMFVAGVATVTYTNAAVFGLVVLVSWLTMHRLLGVEAAQRLVEAEESAEADQD